VPFAALSSRPRLIRFQLLPLLLFATERSLRFQQTFRQFHLNPPPLKIRPLQKRFGVRNQVLLLVIAVLAFHNQQRSFSRSKLHIAHRADRDQTVRRLHQHFTPNEVTDISSACFQLDPLLLRNLQLHPGQLLGIADAIDARKLQHHATLVEPVLFSLQLATGAIRCQRRKLASLGKPLGKTGVYLRQNFAPPALRSQDARDRYEAAGYSTISN